MLIILSFVTFGIIARGINQWWRKGPPRQRDSIPRRGVAETARAESKDGVLGEGQATPSPPNKRAFFNTLAVGARGNF